MTSMKGEAAGGDGVTTEMLEGLGQNRQEQYE